MKIVLLQDFSTAQTVALVGLGTAYWGLAALAIRHGSEFLFGNQTRRLLSFASAIPILYGTINVTESIVSVSPRNRLITSSILLSSALFLDGIAFMWFPDKVYENPQLKKTQPSTAVVHSRMGASWILWGVGATLAMALMTNTAL